MKMFVFNTEVGERGLNANYTEIQAYNILEAVKKFLNHLDYEPKEFEVYERNF